MIRRIGFGVAEREGFQTPGATRTQLISSQPPSASRASLRTWDQLSKSAEEIFEQRRRFIEHNAGQNLDLVI